jgi:hypothetical protein
MLFGGGFITSEELIEKVSATVAPTTASNSGKIDVSQYKLDLYWLYWIGGLILLVILFFILRKVLRRGVKNK